MTKKQNFNISSIVRPCTIKPRYTICGPSIWMEKLSPAERMIVIEIDQFISRQKRQTPSGKDTVLSLPLDLYEFAFSCLQKASRNLNDPYAPSSHELNWEVREREEGDEIECLSVFHQDEFGDLAEVLSFIPEQEKAFPEYITIGVPQIIPLKDESRSGVQLRSVREKILTGEAMPKGEVCAYLNVKGSTVERYVKAGAIRRVGNGYYNSFDVEEVRRLGYERVIADKHVVVLNRMKSGEWIGFQEARQFFAVKSATLKSWIKNGMIKTMSSKGSSMTLLDGEDLFEIYDKGHEIVAMRVAREKRAKAKAINS
jgi:hypothetical protein